MAKQLLAPYDLYCRLYNNVLDQVTDEESNRRLYNDLRINHIKYIAGHLLNSQYGLGYLTGLKMSVKWDNLFAPMGQSEAKDDVTYPALEEVITEWNRISPIIRDTLVELSPDQLA